MATTQISDRVKRIEKARDEKRLTDRTEAYIAMLKKFGIVKVTTMDNKNGD